MGENRGSLPGMSDAESKQAERFLVRIANHPFLVGALAVLGVLATLATIWFAFTRDTVPEFLAKRGVTMDAFQILVVLLALLCIQVPTVAVWGLREMRSSRIPPPPVAVLGDADTPSRYGTVKVEFTWQLGARFDDDSRPEYKGWWHAVFIPTVINGRRASIGTAAYIDIERAGAIRSRLRAEIAQHNKHEHYSYLAPHSQSAVPVYLQLKEMTYLWVDSGRSTRRQLSKGTYVTDSVFFEDVNLRIQLKPGSHRIRAVLVIDETDFCSEWRDFTVE